jgi:hypothetical protein
VKTLEEKQFSQHYYPHGTPETDEPVADLEKSGEFAGSAAEGVQKETVLKEQHLVI